MNLDRIEELARAATPGPWDTQVLGHTVRVVESDGGDVAMCGHVLDQPDSVHDAAYIAAVAPDVALKLIDFVRAAGAAVDNLYCRSDCSDGDAHPCPVCRLERAFADLERP